MYNEFGITALDGYNTPEAPKDKMGDFLKNLFSVVGSPQEKLNNAKFLNEGTKSTIQFLIDSDQFSLTNIGSALKNLDFSGGKRLDKMKDAILNSEKDKKMHVVMNSGEGWIEEATGKYLESIAGDISKLNVTLFHDIVKAKKFPGFFSRGRADTTIATSIALYLQAKKYSSRLVQDVSQIQSTCDILANARWKIEEDTIAPIFKGISDSFKGNPEVQKVINTLNTKFNVPLKPDGTFDKDVYQKQFFLKDENKGKSEVQMLAQMKIDVDSFLKRSEGIRSEVTKQKAEYVKKLGNKKALKEFPEIQGLEFIVEQNGKKVPLNNVSITALRGEDARNILAQIGEKYKTQIPQGLVDLILLLGLQSQESKIVTAVAGITQVKKSLDKKKPIDQRVIDAASRTGKARLEEDNAKKATGNISDQEAWSTLKKLEIKEGAGKLSDEEKRMIADLRQRRFATGNLSQAYVNTKELLGEEEAKRIFVESNQVITNNSKETYDFKALEKIAILTDPESSPGQRALARLEPGKTVSMQKLMEGEMQSSIISSPEIASMNVTMNTSGGFDIPLLKETNLTKPQVQEYMTNIALYADLGLSQLIPHIPLITAELRNKGINTSIDGSTNTMEQQQVLKEIYELLFGKKIETNSLGDVERAFVSSVGNPTSMKNAMQYTLKIHHLIGESGQAIAPDTLQKWIRGTQESTPNKADLLANIQ